MEQLSFSSLDYAFKKKQTKRDKFLLEMDKVVPWNALTELIVDFYPKAGKGRHPIGLEVMLRIYFLQHALGSWCGRGPLRY